VTRKGIHFLIFPTKFDRLIFLANTNQRERKVKSLKARRVSTKSTNGQVAMMIQLQMGKSVKRKLIGRR